MKQLSFKYLLTNKNCFFLPEDCAELHEYKINK